MCHFPAWQILRNRHLCCACVRDFVTARTPGDRVRPRRCAAELLNDLRTGGRGLRSVRSVLRAALPRVRAGWPLTAVFVVALLARLWVVVGDGGFGGDFYYDPAVYYAAGDALTHGRVPYADFVLIHPPLIALVNVPLAWIGRWTSDHVGFEIANVVYTVMAAVNAVLVVRVAQAFGCARRAALLAGLFYAVWMGAIAAEFLVRLEPLGNLVLLLALLAFATARRRTSPTYSLLAGALLGALLSVKIWWIVPVAVLLGWQLLGERATRRTLLMLAGVAGAVIAIDGPFLVVSGGRMLRAVFAAQLDRVSNGVSVHGRLDKLSGLSQMFGDRFNSDSVAGRPGVQVGLLLFLGLLVTAAVIATRTKPGRVFTGVLAAEFIVVLSTPTWFYTYCDYLAVPLGLVVAHAASVNRSGRHAGPVSATGLTAFAAITAVATFVNGGLHLVPALHGTRQLAKGVAHETCVVADTPMALIELNALDRSFTHGCRDWVDLTGVEHGGGPDASDRVVPGRPNSRWSRDLCGYLTSGDAVMIVDRDTWRALPPRCAERIRRSPVLARSAAGVVRRLR